MVQYVSSGRIVIALITYHDPEGVVIDTDNVCMVQYVNSGMTVIAFIAYHDPEV